MNDHIYRRGNWGSLKLSELLQVSQLIMEDVAVLPLNIQCSFHSATLVSGFSPSTVARWKLLRKRKNLPTGISVFCVWRIHSAWAQSVLRCQIFWGHSRLQAHSAGLFWWLATFESPVRLSVPRNRGDSSETWLPKITGLKSIWAFASRGTILNILTISLESEVIVTFLESPDWLCS